MMQEYSNILIDKNASIKDAMKQLDKNTEKILFVVEDSNKLIGSLTDGDIRRWILKEGKLSDTVELVCYKDTLFAEKNYNVTQLKEEIFHRKIVIVPILDENKVIVNFLKWDKLFDDSIKQKVFKEIDIPAVIMAGGKGTRLEPFTNVLPKPLIPIGDKTILECIIDEFRQFSVDQFYITLNYKGAMIEAYFNGTARPYRIDYLWETNFMGTAGSLVLLKGKIQGDMIVSNCDSIVKTDYYDVLDFHRNNNSYLTILSSMQHHKMPYGVVSFKEGGAVTEIVEKPEYSFTINTGIYILNSKALDYIPENSVVHMTHLIDVLIQNRKNVLTYPVNESDYIDIGQWDGYRKAVEKLKL
jgi:dTDP-glucose pyrophosphorylase/CBS domain-containing protein